MQLFYDKGARGKDLQKLNQCRMFLQVTMLSDIVTVDGRYITRMAREGNFDNTWPHYHRWPNQGNPGVNKWTFWREQLSSLLCGGNRDFRLMTALGAWTDTTPETWEWFFCLYEEHFTDSQILSGPIIYRVYSLDSGDDPDLSLLVAKFLPTMFLQTCKE